MKKLYALIGQLVIFTGRVSQFFVKQYQLTRFQRVGTGVHLGKNCTFTSNICVGNDVHIGANCCFQSAHGIVVIGDHVMFGPDVHIHGGNHKFNRVGHLMTESNDKKPGEDGSVTIENDVWIGARTIILKGTRIGRGSIVGAGSIVTKSIPPYSIYTGIPSSRLRQRWDAETVIEHERILLERRPIERP